MSDLPLPVMTEELKRAIGVPVLSDSEVSFVCPCSCTANKWSISRLYLLLLTINEYVALVTSVYCLADRINSLQGTLYCRSGCCIGQGGRLLVSDRLPARISCYCPATFL